MGKHTPIYDDHVAMGAKMVDFSGWEMPIHYGSQVDEHHQVRKDVGMFDVSHMTVVDLQGDDCRSFLQYLLANNVDRLKDAGKALYTCMLNENGGVIDDLIVYYMSDSWFRLVVNAATREKDVAWIKKQAAKFSVQVTEQEDLAMIAVQGPNACDKLCAVLGEDGCAAIKNVAPFYAVEVGAMFIGHTGYTGEDGFEIILPSNQASEFWKKLHQQAVPPIGLGARDTLRLEAGMNLYGTDMDEETTPLESGLGWTVAWEPKDRDFIGRSALEGQREASPERKLVGLVLEGRGVLRNHQKVVVSGVGDGEITSGSFSPTLGKAIAFARVPAGIESDCSVDVRGKLLPAKVVKAPFVRNGKSCLPEDLV